MADGAHAIRRMSAGPSDAVVGKVRVTATEVFGSFFLMSRMRGLVEKNPGLDIEMVIQSRNLSLARRDVDLAIRHARPEGASVITRKIADYASNFYADRSYIEARKGEPLDFIGFTDDVIGQPTALHTIRAAGNQQRYSHEGQYAVRTACCGSGRARCRHRARSSSRTSILTSCEVDVGVEPLVRELWLVAHPDVRGGGAAARHVRLYCRCRSLARATF